MGVTTVGSIQDTSDSNYMTGSLVVTGSQSLSIGSISVYVYAVDTSPNNQFSVAIYADASGTPSSLVAQSSTGTLQPNTWNTLPVTAEPEHRVLVDVQSQRSLRPGG